jgi:hypothetical protein
MRTIKVGVSKKVVFTRISAHISVSNKKVSSQLKNFKNF